jgi:hypothetical protein
MALALVSTCDAAVYAQGVWFLRLSVVLMLASFANYVTLPSKNKPTKTPDVAQVEEIQEAVAVPASEENNLSGQQTVQQGAVVRVPPVPNTQHKQDKKDAGKAILRGRRVRDARKARGPTILKSARPGVVRKRRRAASQGKPQPTPVGVISGLGTTVRARKKDQLQAAGARFRARKVPPEAARAPPHAPPHIRPPSRQTSAQQPITISMHPSQIKKLQFSL